jgi:hypothetical protein
MQSVNTATPTNAAPNLTRSSFVPQNHLEKIAQYSRSNCKNRSGLLVVRPGQLTVPPNAHNAELRCEYFKADRLIKCLLPEPDEGTDKKKKKRLDVSLVV